MLKLFSFLFILVILFTGTAAQDTQTVESQPVEVAAADSLALKGDYYALPGDTPHAAVLLMHQLGSHRRSWSDLIPALLDAGYNVLTVDLRGHGETGGKVDWTAAQTDTRTWLSWLRQQPGVRAAAISIIGASIGSNLALVGCAADEQCVTAIALSPGLDYFGVKTDTAVTEGLRKRSALLVAAQADGQSSNGIKELVAAAKGDIGVRLYAGAAHGTTMLQSRKLQTGLITLIIDWLNEHTPPSES